MNEHLGCCHILDSKTNATMNTYVQVFVQTCVFIFLGYIARHVIAVIDHMIILCLNVWVTTELFSKAGVAFYIPANSVWEFWFLCILWLSVFSVRAIFRGIKWHLIVALTCISLKAHNVASFNVLGGFISSLENCLDSLSTFRFSCLFIIEL